MFEKLVKLIAKASGVDDFQLGAPEFEELGHFTSSVAFAVAKSEKITPIKAAELIRDKILKESPKGFIDRIDVKTPGFINFWMTDEAVKDEFQNILKDKEYGLGEGMRGKKVMVEFTDPNPFKLFHIGHLMSNTIGESFARLYEASGAKVRRANYYGDVGLHIAKSVWGMGELSAEMPSKDDSPLKKMDFLGKAYAFGSRVYEDRPEVKAEIVAINTKIYDRSDSAINKLYDVGLKWSLVYFETIYQRLGTKFDDYFPESSVGGEGLRLVRSRMDIFKESDGAIVFPGEQYGLHTRVFINSQGLPTYEAKELGLNKKKFELYNLDLSVIVTGNEIVDYFKVLIKAMEFVLPEVATKTRHRPHGMLRLPSGKMSSRTGDVITAEALLADIKARLSGYVSEKSDLSAKEREAVTDRMAIGAIKYSILKQAPGQDIVFDFDKSLSVEGDSAPYLFYAYARLRSILNKAGRSKATPKFLSSKGDLSMVLKISRFPQVVQRAADANAPHYIAVYLHELAKAVNRFYENEPVLKADKGIREARLGLVDVAAGVMKSGLNLLGIEVSEKM